MHCRSCGAQELSATVCAACAGQLLAALRTIPDTPTLHGLGADLDTAIARLAVFGRDSATSRSAETPLPVHLAASDARQVLHSTLAAWCRVLADEGHRPGPDDTLPSMAEWLAERVQTVRYAAWADEALDEITAAVANALRAVDRPADRELVGTCDCGAALYAHHGAVRVVCRAHAEPAVYDVNERREAMGDHLREVRATATQAATLLRVLGIKVAASTIRGWARDTERRAALIHPVGHDLDGSPLYALRQVRVVAEQRCPTG